MAFAPHARITFGGTLHSAGDPPEIWSCTVNVRKLTTGDTLGGTLGYIGQVQADLATWFNDASHGIANAAFLTFLKANDVGADGKYIDATESNTYDYTTPAQGGAGPVNPEIISTATSWVTAKMRGPGSHGRIYLPNFTYGPPAAMTIASTDAAAIANSGKELLQVLDNHSGSIVVVPVIASKVDASLTDITGVRVGNIKDVQRRRKNAFPETYQNASYTHP